MATAESTAVEALALDYISLGLYAVVNNFWTLVAVATAAASFWRFKHVPSVIGKGHHVAHDPSPEIPDKSSIAISGPKVNLNVIAPPLTVECSDDGSVSGKRVYTRFCYDDVVDEEEELADEERLGLVVAQAQNYQSGCKTVRFDVLERLRLSDLGVYEHQDLGVLDGCVVKLWDSCRDKINSRATLSPSIVRAILFDGMLVHV